MAKLGRNTAVGFGKETTWGTAVTRTVWAPVVSESMKRTEVKRPRPVLAEASGSRNRRSHYVEADNAGGSIELLMTYEGLGLLLEQALGAAVASTGAGPYTHTFNLGANPLAGLTIEMLRGDGSSEVFEGCKISKATFRIEAGGLMRVTIEVIAETSGGRVTLATPTFTASRDLVIVHNQAGTVSWNSVSYTCKAIELTIDNKFATRQLLGSSTTKEPMPSDYADVLVKLDLEYDTENLYTALLADTESDLTVAFSGPSSRGLTFSLHNAFIEDVSDPINTVGVIAQTATFRGQSDGTDEGFRIVLANSPTASGIAG